MVSWASPPVDHLPRRKIIFYTDGAKMLSQKITFFAQAGRSFRPCPLIHTLVGAESLRSAARRARQDPAFAYLCSQAANVEADTSDLALMIGYTLTEAYQAYNAKCLDGTPGLDSIISFLSSLVFP